MNYRECLDHLLKLEGGYVDHVSDRGGATNMGVTQRVYDQWRLKRGLLTQPVIEMTRAEAELIYWEEYWVPARCEEIPAEVRGIHFDLAVNSGVVRAIKTLQACLGVKADGVIGPKTLAALLASPGPLLKAVYVNQRLKWYASIVNRDRSQRVFLLGWVNRLVEFV